MKLDFYRFGKTTLYLIPTVTINWGWHRAIDITWLQWVLEFDFNKLDAEEEANEAHIFDLLDRAEDNNDTA
tara:strand:+ start:1500 stop:1712 length:213 start_codon:yes stop_codon:yes gene_type:complete